MKVCVILLLLCFNRISDSAFCGPSMEFHDHTKTCVQLVERRLDYKSSMDFCRQNFGATQTPGHLVHIFDNMTDVYIIDMLKRRNVFLAYIGLNDLDTAGVYKWDGCSRTPSYFAWYDNPHNPVPDMAAVIVSPTGWTEWHQQREEFFICQHDAAVPTADVTCPYAEKGRANFTFECTTVMNDNSMFTRMYFSHNGKEIVGCGPSSCSSSLRYKGELTMKNNSLKLVMKILNMGQNDIGNWTCHVTFKSVSYVAADVCEFNYLEPVRLTSMTIKVDNGTMVDNLVPAESNVTVTCNTSGFPVPKLELYYQNYNGKLTLLRNVSGRSLVYRLTGRCNETGRYMCTVNGVNNTRKEKRFKDLKVVCTLQPCNQQLEVSTVDVVVNSTASTRMCFRAHYVPTGLALYKGAEHSAVPGNKYTVEVNYNYPNWSRGEVNITMYGIQPGDEGEYFLYENNTTVLKFRVQIQVKVKALKSLNVRIIPYLVLISLAVLAILLSVVVRCKKNSKKHTENIRDLPSCKLVDLSRDSDDYVSHELTNTENTKAENFHRQLERQNAAGRAEVSYGQRSRVFSRRHTDSGVYVRFDVPETPKVRCFSGDVNSAAYERSIQNGLPLVCTRTTTHLEESAQRVTRSVQHNSDVSESAL